MDALEVDGERRPVAFPQRGKTVDRRAHAPAFAALDEFGLIVVNARARRRRAAAAARRLGSGPAARRRDPR